LENKKYEKVDGTDRKAHCGLSLSLSIFESAIRVKVFYNLMSWLAGWLAGWMAGWLDGWLAGWLAGWMDGWLGI